MWLTILSSDEYGGQNEVSGAVRHCKFMSFAENLFQSHPVPTICFLNVCACVDHISVLSHWAHTSDVFWCHSL